ncbi:hypothetical protein C0J52_12480 [Blattella germanica]|nr:hypothetical protein C0J52_12480 [Blattella germanica]
MNEESKSLKPISRQSIEGEDRRSLRTVSILSTKDAEAMQMQIRPSETKPHSSAQIELILLKTSLTFARRSADRTSRIGLPLTGSLLSFRPSATMFDKSKVARYMNTYRMESKNKFSPDRVKKVIQTVLEKELENVKYDPKNCAKLCMNLTTDLRTRVKVLGFDRGLKFLWDAENDKYATHQFENTYIYASACVYAKSKTFKLNIPQRRTFRHPVGLSKVRKTQIPKGGRL